MAIWGVSTKVPLDAYLKLKESGELIYEGDIHQLITNKYQQSLNDNELNICQSIHYDAEKQIYKTESITLIDENNGQNATHFTSTLLKRNQRLYYHFSKKVMLWQIPCSILFLPLHAALRKVALPTIALIPYSLGLLTDRHREIVEREWSAKMPIKAIVGVVVHPIIGLLALVIPFCTLYFHLLNSDLERWINGHSDEDVMNKSIRRRLYEMPYLLACRQPIGLVKNDIKTITLKSDFSGLERVSKSGKLLLVKQLNHLDKKYLSPLVSSKPSAYPCKFNINGGDVS